MNTYTHLEAKLARKGLSNEGCCRQTARYVRHSSCVSATVLEPGPNKQQIAEWQKSRAVLTFADLL
jgi:hypothetical protein